VENITCCFTGQRDISENKCKQLPIRLAKEIGKLIDCGVERFYTGGSSVFDIMSAEVVLKLREEFSHIKLIFVLSCREQARGLRGERMETHKKILRKADEVICTSESYDSQCAYRRSRYMVENSGFCVCFMEEGCYDIDVNRYMMNYARGKDLRVINLAQGFML